MSRPRGPELATHQDVSSPSTSTRLVRVAVTPWAHDARALRRASARLAAPIRVMAHEGLAGLTPVLDPRLPASRALTQLLRALTGRLVVRNPTGVTRLPDTAMRVFESLARHTLGLVAPGGAAGNGFSATASRALGDARDAADRQRAARALLALGDQARRAAAPRPGVRVCAALHQATNVPVRFADASTGSAPEPVGTPPGIDAALHYRLTLLIDHRAGASTADGGVRDAARDAAHDAARDAAHDAAHDVSLDVAAAGATAVPWPPAPAAPFGWFAARLLVPDVVATRGMDGATLARWAALTGRGGDGVDSYWCADAWARFCERDRMVGFVTPADVGASRRTRQIVQGAGGGFGSARASSFTPDVERGVWVPPGYCLLTCHASLEIAVAALSDV